jgi:hypothetical protein
MCTGPPFKGVLKRRRLCSWANRQRRKLFRRRSARRRRRWRVTQSPPSWRRHGPRRPGCGSSCRRRPTNAAGPPPLSSSARCPAQPPAAHATLPARRLLCVRSALELAEHLRHRMVSLSDAELEGGVSPPFVLAARRSGSSARERRGCATCRASCARRRRRRRRRRRCPRGSRRCWPRLTRQPRRLSPPRRSLTLP